MRLQGVKRGMQHIVVTGASSGLGAALARGYAQRGDFVTCLARDMTRLEDVAAQCSLLSSSRPALIQCDVTDAERMRSVLQDADDARPVDVLIANSGVGGKSVLAPPLGEDVPLASYIMSVNMAGVVNTISPLVSRMAARRQGHIVIVSSIAAFAALPQSPVYSASKAAVYSYGHGLRRLLRAQGIGVSVVSPGFIDTPMSRSLPYARPFLETAARNAEICTHAVDHTKAEVIFPWQLRIAMAVLGVLPVSIADRLLAIASAQAAEA